MKLQSIYEPKGLAREYAALACNLYKGCPHGCTYCYAPAMLHMTREAFHADSVPRADILRKVDRDCDLLRGDTREILMCFTCDPYHSGDTSYTRVALNCIGIHGLKCTVLTKGGMRASRDFDVLKEYGFRYGTTLTTMNPRACETNEPYAASVHDRICAIHSAKSLGIQTWVSIEPVINAQDAISVIEAETGWVDHWNIGKLNHVASPVPVDWTAFVSEVRNLLPPEKYTFKSSLHQWTGGKSK